MRTKEPEELTIPELVKQINIAVGFYCVMVVIVSLLLIVLAAWS